MRAIGFWTTGGPEVLQEVDLPEPHAGPGEVRIAVRAAVVNPTDTVLRAGGQGRRRLARRPPPYVPGMDVAGVVSGLGPGAGWQVGDEVVALVLPTEQHGGAYAEQVVVPGESVARRPRGASMAEAATLPMNGLSAWLALEALALPAGRSIAVSGAAGALGGFVVQLAKAAGLRVIADAAAADEELVRALGADHVLARGNDFATHVRALEPGGVDGAVDAALLNEHIFPAVRDGGALVVVRGRGGNPGRGIRVEPVWVSAAARNSAALARLVTHAEQGIVALRVARVLPAHAAAKAHALLEAGGIRGRLVLEFGRS